MEDQDIVGNQNMGGNELFGFSFPSAFLVSYYISYNTKKMEPGFPEMENVTWIRYDTANGINHYVSIIYDWAPDALGVAAAEESENTGRCHMHLQSQVKMSSTARVCP